MKPLIFAILIPVLIYGALRFEMTPWRLLSGKEYGALQTKIATLEQEVAEAKKVAAEAKKVVRVQQEKVASGAWMRDEKYRSPLNLGTPAGPGKTK